MTPAEFSSNANAWIDAITGIAGHLLTTVGLLLALPAYVQIKNRLDRHRTELDALKPDAPAPAPDPSAFTSTTTTTTTQPAPVAPTPATPAA